MTDAIATDVTVNGRPVVLAGSTATTLADALRAQLYLTGVKISCDQGVCGACTVLVDGAPTAACMTFLFTLGGCSIETIESLSTGGRPHPVQQAFIDESAFQCGFCTPGMVMLVKALFEAHPDPDDATVRRWLSSNVCRCTGYAVIFRAVDRLRRTRSAVTDGAP